MVEEILFYVAGAGLVVTAVLTVVAKSPLRGALSLITSLCLLAGLFVLLDASFVAAMQVLVYAGAIMVLFLFVIMLLNLRPDAQRRPRYVSASKVLGGVAAAYFVFRVLQASMDGRGPGKVVDGSVKNIGVMLLTDYLFAFEAISVLLLVAVVGAVVLGLKRLT